MALMLGVLNRIDASSLSSGSYSATLPLSSIQTRLLGQVARSSDATNASTKFDIDLTVSDKVIRVISIINHNFSLTAQYRIRGATDAAFTSVLIDTGTVDVWPVVYPLGSLEFEDSGWWVGKPTAEDRAGVTSNLCCILASNTVARYWRVEIFDTTNSDGYVQFGRVFIGSGYLPVNDASTGMAIGWDTTTTMTRALSGAKYFQARTPYRVVNFTLDVLSVDEGMSNIFEIDRRSGLDQEVIYIFDTADTFHQIRRRFLGTVKQMNPIEYPYANIYKKAYSIEESL